MRKYLRALHSNLCKDDVLHSDVYMLLEYPNSLEQALFLFHKILGILDRAIEFLVWLPGGHIPGDGLHYKESAPGICYSRNIQSKCTIRFCFKNLDVNKRQLHWILGGAKIIHMLF